MTMPMTKRIMTLAEREAAYTPDPTDVAASQLTAFMRYCEDETGRSFPDQAAFYRFSVEEFRLFWLLLTRWSGLAFSGPLDPVCTDDACERAAFFPNLRLSYAENVLRSPAGADDDQPVLTARHVSAPTEHLTRPELRSRVVAFSAALTELGVVPGDRIVAIVGNSLETAVAGLASTAVGATFSTASPEMGVMAVLSRFRQLTPSILITSFDEDGHGLPVSWSDRVVEVVTGLPSLDAIIALDEEPAPSGIDLPVHRMSQLVNSHADPRDAVDWHRFPFNHPLFILFSSGTTGPPKCIVHGAGGTLLEHVKEHRLHTDLRPTDTLFFHTSAAWMMWNWQLSALASGARIVVYDGPIADPETLWRVVSEERVTVFGTSPPYLKLCQDVGYSPRRELPLGSLRAVLSTGSILRDGQYDWVHDQVGSVPVQSISGGTDIIGCFVLGSPNLPVYRGESQCRSLGLDVQTLRSEEQNGSLSIGELVCSNPFPSRPLGFYGDTDGTSFHDAYFDQNPGLWTHGDLIEISDEGSARLHGRSDAVINVGGARIGPAEIYRVLEDMPEIRDAMAVEQRFESPETGRIVLLVVLHERGTLDADFRTLIRREVARNASPAHVPAVIAEVEELPVTHSGKQSERAVRDMLEGIPVRNVAALRNPGSLAAIAGEVERADEQSDGQVALEGGLPLLEEIRDAWERVLGIAPIGLDDNFFDLGGTSLKALSVLQELSDHFGRELPQSTLLEAPTITTMAALCRDMSVDDYSALVLLTPGSGGQPLFLVHGVFGEVFEFQQLAARLRHEGPVYAIRARGLDTRQEPHTRVDEMATYYLEHVRRAQPHGPYNLIGFSFGGLIVFEMAQQLRAAGEEIHFLGLLDADLHEACLPLRHRLPFQLKEFVRRGFGAARAPRTKILPFVLELVKRVIPALPYERKPLNFPPLLLRVQRSAAQALKDYRPAPYPDEATFFRAEVRRSGYCDPLPVWFRVVEGGLTVFPVPGGHAEILHEPQVKELAEALAGALARS
jgi:acetoacetyl-CoA synthetase